MNGLEVGKEFVVTGLLPFDKHHLQGKKGVIIGIDMHKAFPVEALIDGQIEHFTITDIYPQ